MYCCIQLESAYNKYSDHMQVKSLLSYKNWSENTGSVIFKHYRKSKNLWPACVRLKGTTRRKCHISPSIISMKRHKKPIIRIVASETLSFPEVHTVRCTVPKIEKEESASCSCHSNTLYIRKVFASCLNLKQSSILFMRKMSASCLSLKYVSAKFFKSLFRCVDGNFGSRRIVSDWFFGLLVCFNLASEITSDVFNPSFDEGFNVIIDSGASMTYTNCLSDFVGDVSSIDNVNIAGIGSNLSATARGTVRWIVHTDNGLLVPIEIDALYVPALPIRLLSPQQLGKQNISSDQPTFTMRGNTSTLVWQGHSKTITHQAQSTLPVLFASTARTTNVHKAHLSAYVTLSHDNRSKFSKGQLELLHIHNRLCHLPMDIIQKCYPVSKAAKSCRVPVCASCSFGKQTRHPFRKSASGQISKDNMKPGDLISTDHFESSLPGRYFTGSGSHIAPIIRICTLFRDSASHLMFVHLQQSTKVSETVLTKSKFERFCHQFGVQVKSYRADNGIFASTGFVDNIRMNDQSITYATTGAHHQNGIAERGIRTVSNWARTALIHGSMKWEEVTPDLWPFAVLYAVDVWNNTQTKNQRAPLDVFSNIGSATVSHFHPFRFRSCSC